jgi:hypothetical protein
MLAVPEHKLKEWKAAGCPALRYSRVYHADLLNWIKNKGGEAHYCLTSIPICSHLISRALS